MSTSGHKQQVTQTLSFSRCPDFVSHYNRYIQQHRTHDINEPENQWIIIHGYTHIDYIALIV